MQCKVEICGVNTAKLKVLKNDETRALLARAKEGDMEAREELIAGNLRLVLSVIQKFSGRGENVDDLFQVGCIGLIKAIDNFDMSQEVKFSTYGVPMISGEIRRYLRDNSALRVSRSLRDTAYRVMQAKEALIRANQREPTVDEIAKELGIPVAEVVMSMDAISDPVSLFDPVYSDGGESVSVMDQIGDSKNTDAAWLERIALTEAVDKLGEREKRILSMRFFDGKTQMEVASVIGISQAQVSRLEKTPSARLKKHYFPRSRAPSLQKTGGGFSVVPCYPSSSGMRKTNSLPFPSWLVRSMRPPWRRAICWAMDRPRPRLPSWFCRAGSA